MLFNMKVINQARRRITPAGRINNMANEDRGFASMDPDEQKDIARKGGQASKSGDGRETQDDM
jgi:general stress protein YciG